MYICICMYACTYITRHWQVCECMFPCKYVCVETNMHKWLLLYMCVCLYSCMDECMYTDQHTCLFLWMSVPVMHKFLHMFISMYVSRYVRVYAIVFPCIWTQCNQQHDQEHWYTYISHYWHMPLNKYVCHTAHVCPMTYPHTLHIDPTVLHIPM